METPKILRFASKINANGNSLQIEIDTTNKTYTTGYYLFVCDSETIRMNKKELRKLENQILWFGFKKK